MTDPSPLTALDSAHSVPAGVMFKLPQPVNIPRSRKRVAGSVHFKATPSEAPDSMDLDTPTASILTPPNSQRASAAILPTIHTKLEPVVLPASARRSAPSTPSTPPESPLEKPALQPQPSPSTSHSQPPASTSPLLDASLYESLAFSSPDVPLISARTLTKAIDYHYSHPLPDVNRVFPWMHGLHPSNLHQRAFLDPHKRFRDRSGVYFDLSQINEEILVNDTSFRPPSGVRGLVIIKVGDEANLHGTLVGTVRPSEVLARKRADDDWIGDFTFVSPHNMDVDLDTDNDHDDETPTDDDNPFLPKFLVLDPVEGISLRNFQIQIAKWATIADICVYCATPHDVPQARKLAHTLGQAQQTFRDQNPHIDTYHTFLCSGSISEFLQVAPHVVSIPPHDRIANEDEVRLKNWDSNFLFHERVEMSMTSSASRIAFIDKPQDGSVWLGNQVDFEAYVDMHQRAAATGDAVDEAFRARNWATFIECFEGPQLPPLPVLDQYINEAALILECAEKGEKPTKELTPLSIQFPSSGCLALSQCNDDAFYAVVSLCKLLYLRTKVPYMGSPAGVLMYCNDGYTETSLLALAYIIYSTGVSASQAWVDLHVKYNRPFFCFGMDMLVIIAMEEVLLEYSPAVEGSKFSAFETTVYDDARHHQLTLSPQNVPSWFSKLDGSFPSKILPHVYLGSLQHAENPGMLAQLGIKRVLSVGETLSWVNYDGDEDKKPAGLGKVYDKPHEGIEQVMYMDNIQDDGVDELTSLLARCLEFLDEGFQRDEPTLVHCRVGVSRSATVCIAEVMKRLGVGLPRAYLFVRVRRLNVIIQPNLRFMFELVKWEEMNRRNGEGWLREVDWHVFCREIAIMNKAYIA